MAKEEKIMVTDHIVEIRHGAVGSFLDVRGFVADYIRSSGFLPHWKIDTNVVSFRDQSDRVEKEGAFAGYKSFGYFTNNPPTANFFQDRAISFIKTLLKNNDYTIPEITRFGCRTKVFIPCELEFDLLNQALNEKFITNTLREIVLKKETDMQIVLEYQEKGYNARLTNGPMHKDEIKKHMDFDSDYFSKVGLYIDLDYFKTTNVDSSNISNNIKDAMTLTWEKINSIAKVIGI